MARKYEPLNFAGSLEVQSQKPLDGRRKVTLIADLTDAASFPYIYKGLDVFCEENSKWYTFLGGDSTDANNWRMEGSGGGGSPDWSDITNKPTDLVQDASYVHTDNNYTTSDKDKLASLENYDDTALAARVTANETAIADRYTKAEADALLADKADKATTYTKTETDALLDGKSSFDIATISTAGGGSEVHATLSQDTDTANINYYKTTELPNALNLNVGDDAFRIPTTGYADEKAAQAQSNAQTYADLKLTQKQDTLVSGQNIKTINGQPVVGSGDLILHQGVGDGLDLNDMPSYNQLEQMINNNALLYIDGNWLVTGLYLESTTAQVVGEYANKTRSYYFDTDFNLDAPMIYGGTYVEGYSTNPNMIVNADSSQPYGEFTRGDGQVFRVWGLDQRIGIDFTDQRGRQQRRNYDMGTHIAVNEEKWVGTYKDDSGTTYHVYSKMIFIPALPATAGVEGYPHGITGIKQILQVYGFTTDGFVLNAPRQNIQDNIGIYQVQKAGNIQIEVGKDRSSKAAYVCLVYAKNN